MFGDTPQPGWHTWVVLAAILALAFFGLILMEVAKF
jgi:hypothetical protein